MYTLLWARRPTYSSTTEAVYYITPNKGSKLNITIFGHVTFRYIN